MTNFKHYDVLIVGGGIFGISAAIELSLRKYSIGLINPDTIPHHLASSTDISKAVRMEYGSDSEYAKMAEMSIEKWREWNEVLGEEIYHEVGFLMLCKQQLYSASQKYERTSYENLRSTGYQPERLDAQELSVRFPVVNSEIYKEASFNACGGYAESGRAVELLANYAISVGVDVHLHQTASKIQIENGTCTGVITKEGSSYKSDHVLISAGAHTMYLLPELQPYMRSTGHSVFWLIPDDPKPFTPPLFSVFTADISNSGWYGFPFHAKMGVVKIGMHSEGSPIHPDHDDRVVPEIEINDLRLFLKMTFPTLENAPLVYTRKCLYTDTLDGHFWIDRHPEVKGLSVCSGGSGHGFKMGPIVGQMAADVVEGNEHQFAKRYRWRHLDPNTQQKEEARNV